MVLTRQYPNPDTADHHEPPRVAQIGPDSAVLLHGEQAQLVNTDLDGNVVESLPASPGEIALARQALEWADVCQAQAIDPRAELRLGDVIAHRVVDDLWQYRWEAIETRVVSGTGGRVIALHTTLPRGMSLVAWLKELSGFDPTQSRALRLVAPLRRPEDAIIDIDGNPVSC